MATLAGTGGHPTTRVIAGDSDHELVEAVRAGDDRAFEQLYERYRQRVAAYVHGMVRDHGRAEDLTQEAFLSALRRIRETDRPIAFKPWIYEIARNACIDAWRRSRRGEEVSIDAGEGSGRERPLAATGLEPDAAVEQKLALNDLQGAFGGLSEAHHRILVMRELEGLSYREIGERLGMTAPAVESTLFRARRRLGEEYEELVSGRRCVRVQAIITAAAEGAVGVRDRRRLARHVAHCAPCRRHARVAGLAGDELVRAPIAGRIAALLPLPAILKRRWLGVEDAADAASGMPALSHWSAALAPYAEPAGGPWAKAAATVATVLVAGVGAGGAIVAKDDDGPAARPEPAASVTAQRSASATAPAGTTTSMSAPQRRATRERSSTGARPTTGQETTTTTVGAGPASGGQAPATAGTASATRAPSTSTSTAAPSGAGTPSSAGAPAIAPQVPDATGSVPSPPTVDPGALTEPVLDTVDQAVPALQPVTDVVRQTQDSVGQTVNDVVKQTGDAVGGLLRR